MVSMVHRISDWHEICCYRTSGHECPGRCKILLHRTLAVEHNGTTTGPSPPVAPVPFIAFLPSPKGPDDECFNRVDPPPSSPLPLFRCSWTGWSYHGRQGTSRREATLAKNSLPCLTTLTYRCNRLNIPSEIPFWIEDLI